MTVHIYLPHGRGAHVSHENYIILLYRRIQYLCIRSILGGQLVRSRHTHGEKNPKSDLSSKTNEKNFMKPIKMPTKDPHRRCARRQSMSSIDRKLKLVRINYKTSTYTTGISYIVYNIYNVIYRVFKKFRNSHQTNWD